MSQVVQLHQKPEPDSFDEAWLHFPPHRRTKRAVCLNMFNAITSEQGFQTRALNKDSGKFVDLFLKATPAEIVAGIKAYDRSMRGEGTERFTYKDGGKFCVSLEVFLNQGRWMDFV